jgi:exonuclease VII large subunit
MSDDTPDVSALVADLLDEARPREHRAKSEMDELLENSATALTRLQAALDAAYAEIRNLASEVNQHDQKEGKLKFALDAAEKENERLRDEAVQRVLDAPDGETIARAVAEYGSAEAAVQEVENTKLIFERARADAAEKRAEEWKEQAYVWEIRARNDEARADAAESALADALAAKDTAEAQVAKLLEAWAEAGPLMLDERLVHEGVSAMDKAVASLPDSAAAMRAVVEAAVEKYLAEQNYVGAVNQSRKVRGSAINRVARASIEFSKAVAAYMASRTGGEEQG